jgi:hypothetical protein
MDNFDLKKYLAEGRLLKEELVDKIKQIKDYNKTEDSLNYGGYDITYDRDENLYSVFPKEGDDDSSDIPDFESSNPSDVEDFLKGIDYLKDAFKTYLAGGDTFTNKPGEIETVNLEKGNEIPEEKFEAALQSLPTTVKIDVYNVSFKKVGDNIVGTFKIK